jgi:CheY-like chemotaxis protein
MNQMEKYKAEVKSETHFFNTNNEALDLEMRGISKNASEGKKIKKLKILIAEDDQISSVLLGKLVRNFSKEVLIVNNGIETVEACCDHPDIDLILMDIKMPLLDGYEATQLIRKFNTSVVIIAQSAFALNGDKEKAIAAGCNDYISKPIIKEHLTELINKHFWNSESK